MFALILLFLSDKPYQYDHVVPTMLTASVVCMNQSATIRFFGQKHHLMSYDAQRVQMFKDGKNVFDMMCQYAKSVRSKDAIIFKGKTQIAGKIVWIEVQLLHCNHSGIRVLCQKEPSLEFEDDCEEQF